MKTDFTRLMKKLNIKPAMSETQRFYEWLQNMGNVHLNDHEQVSRAFHKVATFKVNSLC